MTNAARFFASLLFLSISVLTAEPVLVRHAEGLLHGFLLLCDSENKIIAQGDLIQNVTGPRATTEFVLQFKDGSVQEETTVFLQRRTFQLVSYHLMQKGKAFKRSTDLRLDAASGKVSVVSVDEKGKQESYSERMHLPNDVANGLVTTLLHDIDPKIPMTTVSMVVATPKPRLVKLEISPEGEDTFAINGFARKAERYVVKIKIGGVAGIVAPLVGKQPADIHIWAVGGKAPGFLKSEGPLYEDGPIWKIELTSPTWPGTKE